MLALSSDGRSGLELFRTHGGHLPLAIGAAAMVATLFAFAASRESPPGPGFVERWEPVPMRAVVPSKQVRTLTFVPTASAVPLLPEIEGFVQLPIPPKMQDKAPPLPPQPPARIVQDDPPPRAPAERLTRSNSRAELKGPDICRGKGRITTRGGKSWRCRR